MTIPVNRSVAESMPGSGPRPSQPRGSAVAVVSAKGSPGVTTSAVLLAAVWPGGATLLEADPAGGDLRTLFDDPTRPPLRPDLGVVSLLTAQAALPSDVVEGAGSALMEHSQRLPGGLPVVLGPSTAAQVEALRTHWGVLPELLTRSLQAGGTFVVDAGRLSDPSSMALTLPLFRVCDTALIVTRATVTAASHTRELLTLLRQIGIPAQVLLIGDERDAPDMARALDVTAGDLLLLPDDPVSAAALTGPWTRRLDRSRLLTAARLAAGTLYARCNAPSIEVHQQARGRSGEGAGPVAGVIDLNDAGVVTA